MNCEFINIKEIYIPTKHLKDFNPKKAIELADTLMEGEEFKPITIRKGKGRYVLIEGVHRLQACKALGEDKIFAHIKGARDY